ncbi:hypothetical protein [Peptoniphilus indolicus]|uniref:Regulatory protein YycH domain-containing protein n=2 Tax=Peptoniphilus indolicus TaxID=33030 RepID=G4D2D7_9FIRM|nr:hypothetical protein [Peptoniphilus indolicus]EGY80308.1 hypothetical protein HMPREF9129_0567 [Peptoniphilus indolicus ATCC 29427]SUB75351.1 Uncharacterised protein [Peptoniphilus indolicus]
MNREHEYILNIILIALAGLTLFLSNILWVDLKKSHIPTTKIEDTDYATNDLFKELLKPQKMVANYNGQHHAVYDFDDIYNTYRQSIYEIFSNSNTKNGQVISLQEYLKLQDLPSLVFFYSSPVDLSIIVNLIGKSDSNDSPILIKEIYLSREFIIVSDGTNHYRFDKNTTIDFTLSALAGESLPEYKNLNELYNVEKNIYLPNQNSYLLKTVKYSNDLKSLISDESYVNNLATRFLNQNDEHIRDIVQDNSRSLIYGNEYLTLYTNGIIEYKNLNVPESKTRNLHTSLKNSISFISNKVGNAGIYISQITPIENNGDLGFRFSFNLYEDSIPVIINDTKNPYYIEIESYGDTITYFKQNYRKSISESPLPEKVKFAGLERIIKTSLTVFNEPFEEVLKNISDIGVAYIDNTSHDQTELKHSIFIKYNNRRLFFSMESGRLLMEK